MTLFSSFGLILLIGSNVFFNLPEGTIYLTCSETFQSLPVDGCGSAQCSDAVFSYFEYLDGTIVPILPEYSSDYNQYTARVSSGLWRFNFEGYNRDFYNGTTADLVYFNCVNDFSTKNETIHGCDIIGSCYNTGDYNWSYIYNNKPISVNSDGYVTYETSSFKVQLKQ